MKYDLPHPAEVTNELIIPNSEMVMLQIFHKRMPPEAIDLVSRLLQYSPNLRCTAVSFLMSSCFVESLFAVAFLLIITHAYSMLEKAI